MGTIVPVLTTLTKTVGAISAFGGAVNTLTGYDDKLQRQRQDQAMRDLQARQQQQLAEANADAAEKRAQIALSAEEAEDRRRAALKRAIAKRNARFGATGIGGSGGSREAVLLGLYDESEAEKQRAKGLDKLRYSAIDTDLSNLTSRNILEQTQLSESQRLSALASRYS